jgi:hypothetical protein
VHAVGDDIEVDPEAVVVDELERPADVCSLRMSTSAGAIRESYNMRARPRVRPSCCAWKALKVVSATDPMSGSHAFAVSIAREPDFARFRSSVCARSWPPDVGVQCSVSSITANVTSAPSAADADEVMTSSCPPSGV